MLYNIHIMINKIINLFKVLFNKNKSIVVKDNEFIVKKGRKIKKIYEDSFKNKIK
jgi:hypothetical protein